MESEKLPTRVQFILIVKKENNKTFQKENTNIYIHIYVHTCICVSKYIGNKLDINISILLKIRGISKVNIKIIRSPMWI